MAQPLTEIFAGLRAITGQCKVAIKVDCNNSETVYIEQCADGRFMISDRYETFAYLSESTDTYLSMAELGKATVEKCCVQHNVALIDLFPDDGEAALEAWMAIGTYATTNDQVRDAVGAVAACVDAIFDQAMKRRE
jgi:hypothetical protein